MNSSWGVLVDPKWTLTSGLWAPHLKAPDGAPAILFNPSALVDRSRAKSDLAHELTHLIHHRYRPHEDNWVREGVALLAEFVATGRFYPGLVTGFEEPESSLVASTDPTALSEIGDAQGAQYGHLTQFFYYLYRLCGGGALLDALLTGESPARGVEFVDETLVARFASGDPSIDSVCAGFEPAFRAFSVARFVNDPSDQSRYVVAGPRYRGTVRAQPPKLPPYSAGAYEISAAKARKAGSKGCQKPDDIRWPDEEPRCIRVRFK